LSPEQLDNALKYGLCRVCGEPREQMLEEMEPGVWHAAIVCPNSHPQR
jgi:hypothetical protein